MSKKRFVKLSWDILRYKVLYYYFYRSEISDDEYDILEQEYLKLCIKLNKENTLVHKVYPNISGYKGNGMMEIDLTRPSVQLVINKIKGTYYDKTTVKKSYKKRKVP